ncbi:MAG TPA: adhesin, partial [Polaribacter sp.]|nr:adhesin [Polaribacter sp.]
MKLMKNLLKLSKIILLLLTFFTVLSCSDDKSVSTFIEESKTILEIAVNEPDLSNLVTALSLADGNLGSLLIGGEYTLLAPNNFAFDLFLTNNGFASLEDVPPYLLSKILLNHVISGTVNSTALTSAVSGYATTNATNM